MWGWVISTGLFWTVAAVYLGGMPVRIEGRPMGQLLGLIGTFLLYQGVWHGLAAVLGRGIIAHYVLPTAIATLALPLITWIGFRIMGARVRFGDGPAH